MADTKNAEGTHKTVVLGAHDKPAAKKEAEPVSASTTDDAAATKRPSPRKDKK